MLIKKIPFVIALVLCFVSASFATTYYVKTGGNDAAAGTSDGTAWAHSPDMDGWTGGTSPLTSGDTVYFREGDTWTSAAAPIINATAGVTYRGLGYGTTDTKAIIRSSRGQPIAGTSNGIFNVFESNVNIYDLELDGDNSVILGIGIGFNATKDIGNINVERCYVHDIGFDDIYHIPSTSVTVSNDATYTYFTKAADSVDWTEYAFTFSINTVTWTGFSSAALNNTAFVVKGVTHDQIKVLLIGGGAYTDTNTVTADSFVVHYLYGVHIGQSNTHTVSRVNILDNTVQRCSHECVSLYPSSGSALNAIEDIVVRNNTIGDCGYLGGDRWGSALDVGLNATNILFEHNYLYNGFGKMLGVVVYPAPEVAPENVTIRYNIVHNIDGAASIGMSFKPDDHVYGDVDFYGNILIDCGIEFSAGSYDNANILIYNNDIITTLENKSGIYFNGAAGTDGIDNISIKNNIISTGSSSAAYCVKDQAAHLAGKMSNNLYYRASGVNLVNYDGVTGFYTAATIGTWDANAVTSDPLFTGGDLPTGFANNRPKTNYFLPETGSPAYYNGTATLKPVVDIRGYPYSASAPSIGAYERLLGNPAHIGVVGATARPGVGAAATIGN